MITSINELKDFLLWARAQKLKSIEVAGIKAEFSELAHVESLPNVLDETSPAGVDRPAASAKLADGNKEIPEEEQLLYWSTR